MRLNVIETSNQIATMTENRWLAPMRLMDGNRWLAPNGTYFQILRI
jgi:hypothetical protein